MCYYTMAAAYWRYKIFPLFCSHKSNIIRKTPLSSVFCEYLYYINIPYRSRLGGRQNPPSVTELNNLSGSILSAHKPTSTFANAHRRPKVRLSLVVEPFFQCSLPYGAKNKKTPNRELFCFGTLTGIGFAATALIR